MRKVPITEIKTVTDVTNFFNHLMVVESLNFHPDNNFSDYQSVKTSDIPITEYKPTYTASEAKERDTLMSQCFDICENEKIDIYDIAMQVSNVYDIYNFIQFSRKTEFKLALQTFCGIDSYVSQQWADTENNSLQVYFATEKILLDAVNAMLSYSVRNCLLNIKITVQLPYNYSYSSEGEFSTFSRENTNNYLPDAKNVFCDLANYIGRVGALSDMLLTEVNNSDILDAIESVKKGIAYFAQMKVEDIRVKQYTKKKYSLSFAYCTITISVR